jgi:hypothetical protein
VVVLAFPPPTPASTRSASRRVLGQPGNPAPGARDPGFGTDNSKNRATVGRLGVLTAG